MKRQPVTIENWSIVGRKLSVYEAPELQTYQIKGEVYNHPGFDNGESITTSTIRHWALPTLIMHRGASRTERTYGRQSKT